MFERLLVATDGSEAGSEAVGAAMEVAQRFGSEVVILHVREHKVTWAADIDLETAQEALTFVEAAVHELTIAGVSARGEIVRAPCGQMAQQIVHAAEQVGASLVVMGTRGLGDAKALLLGSVAHDVLRQAPCAVLVTPAGSMAVETPHTVVQSVEEGA